MFVYRVYNICQLHSSAQSWDFHWNVCSCTVVEAAGGICERYIDQRLWPAIAEDTAGQGTILNPEYRSTTGQTTDGTAARLQTISVNYVKIYTHNIRHICVVIEIFLQKNLWNHANDWICKWGKTWVGVTKHFNQSDEQQEMSLETWQVVGFSVRRIFCLCQNHPNKCLIHSSFQISKYQCNERTQTIYVNLETKFIKSEC